MTALAAPTALTDHVGSVGAPRLLAGLEAAPVVGAGPHRARHGRLPALDRERLTGLAESVRLVGRGGAGYPVGAKLRATGARPVVVVNGHESEPASGKDRVLLQRVPHLVLDGVVLVAAALDATRVVVDVGDPAAAQAVRAACLDRTDCGAVEVRTGAGGFVAGEARAVVRALGGGPALPPGRRVPPSTRGVGGRPTFLSNVETFAQLAVLAHLGTAAYGRTGTPAEPGTSLLTVSGAVDRPGVLEVPTGVPLSVVAATAGARPGAGVVLGGYHGTWWSGGDVALSPTALRAAGATAGAGVVAFVGDDTCALGELAGVAAWLARQSARQCGPCLSGLPALAATVAALARGTADPADVDVLAGLVAGRGACAHPDGAVRLLTSAVRVLPGEIAAHRRSGTCGRPVRGHLAVPAT